MCPSGSQSSAGGAAAAQAPVAERQEEMLLFPHSPALLFLAHVSNWLNPDRNQVMRRLSKYTFITLSLLDNCLAICSNLYKPESHSTE